MPVVVVDFQDGGWKQKTTCGMFLIQCCKIDEKSSRKKQSPNTERIRNILHVVTIM